MLGRSAPLRYSGTIGRSDWSASGSASAASNLAEKRCRITMGHMELRSPRTARVPGSGTAKAQLKERPKKAEL